MLKNKIDDDFKAAFKAKDEAVVSVLKMLKAAILNKTKDKEFLFNKQGKDIAQATLGDEEIVDVVSAEIKKLRDSLALFDRGGRVDLAEGAKAEIAILMRYLPEQLSEDEIKKLVSEAVAQSGAAAVKDMGKVMGILMPKMKGKADTGLVSKLVKEALS
ncbi:MAG: GatB/YqeY domain-containing protein [Candidatus Nealsonbacteria bacterium DGGOD1a]|jgi:uncharacterized protein YqeY|nr:MAG: GatB/YqeY domain-containing protein [Candidatus Nealsonbacteria bacterium DGGOD1a]